MACSEWVAPSLGSPRLCNHYRQMPKSQSLSNLWGSNRHRLFLLTKRICASAARIRTGRNFAKLIKTRQEIELTDFDADADRDWAHSLARRHGAGCQVRKRSGQVIFAFAKPL